jgi:glycerol kinase
MHVVQKLFHAMAAESNTALVDLKLNVGGGISVNNSLMQWQAGLAEVSIHRSGITAETTAAGAAFAAGLERNCFIYICNNFTTCCWKNPCPDKSSSWASSSVKRWEKGIQRSLPGAASDIL